MSLDDYTVIGTCFDYSLLRLRRSFDHYQRTGAQTPPEEDLKLRKLFRRGCLPVQRRCPGSGLSGAFLGGDPSQTPQAKLW